MTYDEYLKHIDTMDHDSLSYASFVSLLPLFPLSLKLLERKNRGKKPFSFDFNEKKERIGSIESDFRRNLENKEIDKESMDLLLSEFVLILTMAKDEIRNAGLRNDFVYMIDEVNQVMKG